MLSPGMLIEFVRGQSLYEGESPGVQPNLLGHVHAFEGFPVEKVEAAGQPLTGIPTIVQLVKNASGIILKPGRLITFLNDASNPWGTAVGGYAYAATDIAHGVVDEFFSQGVQPNDIFFIVRKGYTKVRTPNSGTPAIAIRDLLIPAAGTSATNDDAGRVGEAAGTKAASVAEILSSFGRAQEACVTANTLFRAYVDFMGRDHW
jgi:hypothetical protein